MTFQRHCITIKKRVFIYDFMTKSQADFGFHVPSLPRGACELCAPSLVTAG